MECLLNFLCLVAALEPLLHFIMREQAALADQDLDLSEALSHFATGDVLSDAILDAWEPTGLDG